MAKTMTIERSALISAAPEQVSMLVRDFTRWVAWSPWESVDPAMRREYGGEAGAIGSTYAWSGNKKAGAGTMRVTGVAADAIDIDLTFTKPFRSSNKLRFTLVAEGSATRVTWQMTAPKTLLSTLLNIEKFVGPDFEKGLRQLDAAVRGAAAG